MPVGPGIKKGSRRANSPATLLKQLHKTLDATPGEKVQPDVQTLRYSAQPPSIKWVWPLMKADSSEAR